MCNKWGFTIFLEAPWDFAEPLNARNDDET